MVIVGTEKRLVHIEVSDNQIADVIVRSNDNAFKVGVQEKVKEKLLEKFNVGKDQDDRAEYIGLDNDTLCYAKEEDHYHGSLRTKFFRPLSKKELDILENMNKMLSVFD